MSGNEEGLEDNRNWNERRKDLGWDVDVVVVKR